MMMDVAVHFVQLLTNTIPILLLLSLLFSVCTAVPGKLRAATCVETYPPFIMRNEVDGSLNGLEIDQVPIVCEGVLQYDRSADVLNIHWAVAVHLQDPGHESGARERSDRHGACGNRAFAFD
jgi:hypothetical protein